MAQSIARKIKRGNIKVVWNKTFQRPEAFKLSSKGRYIACNPFSGNYAAQGPGYSKKQIERMDN